MNIAVVAEPKIELVTRTSFRLHLRPVAPEDKAQLADFFSRLTPEDLRFRFLSAAQEVSSDTLSTLMSVDHQDSEDFLAFDDEGELVASAVVAGDRVMERAEVAISVRSDLKGRGIGWTLLEYLGRIAAERGFQTIESIESRDNRAVIELEAEMGFRAQPYEGDPRLVLVSKTLR